MAVTNSLEIICAQRENLGRRKELMLIVASLVAATKENPKSDAVPVLDEIIDESMAKLKKLQDEFQELKCQISQTS